MVRRKLALKSLRLDGDTQPRAGMDPNVVAEYAAHYKAGVKMPPLVVFDDGKDKWLADGFHRRFGAKEAGLAKVDCDIRKGTLADARWFACAANQSHGLRRTNEDKAQAVRKALRHPKGVELSDRQIAEHVGVDQKTVVKYRGELETTEEIPQSPTRTGRDGRTINTANVGFTRKPPAPKTQPKEYAVFASAKGDSLRSIAEATGKHRQTIKNWLDSEKCTAECTTRAEPVAWTDAEIEAASDTFYSVVQRTIDQWLSQTPGASGIDIRVTLLNLAEEYAEP